MSVGAAAPRRKATTYGKLSRKPVITATNPFAMAAGTDKWDIPDNPVDWLSDSIPASELSLRASDGCARRSSLAVTAIPRLTRLDCHKQRHSLLSEAPDSAESDSLFDMPSSDNENPQHSSASTAVPRKRRKISPEPVLEIGPLVYDDVSLQRHIAAEFEKEFSHGHFCSMSTVSGDIARIGRTLRESVGEMDYSTPEKQRDAPKTHRLRSHEDLSDNCGCASLDMVSRHQSKARSIAERRANDYLTCKTPRRTAKKASMGTGEKVTTMIRPEAKPTTPDSVAYASTLSSSPINRKGVFNSEERFCPPSTPPRPTNLKTGTTTPRQRALWDKLLVEDAPHASPTNLDLPGLRIARRTSEIYRQPVLGGKVTGENSEKLPLKPPNRKIVDTLHPTDQDQNHLEDEHSQNFDSAWGGSLYESTNSGILTVNGATTLQPSLSANSQGSVKQCNVSNNSQPIPSLHGAGLKVTYARQRSYLTDDDLDEVAMLSMAMVSEPVLSQGISRKRPGPQSPKSHSMHSLDRNNGNNQDPQGGAIRSIHELREAGGNVRLVGELEAMLDDIEDGQPSSRPPQRTLLLDLVTKLQEPSNCRLFIDRGLETRLMAYAGIGTDLISNSLLAAAMLQLIAGPTLTALPSHISNARIVNFLIDLLKLDQDLASQVKLRQYNVSKYAQQEYNRICSSISASAAWRAGKPTVLSCHVLALQCLEYLVRGARESGSLSTILSAPAIRRIVSRSIPPVTIRVPQWTRMLAIHLELAISILESCTIYNAPECQESLWEGDTLERVMKLLPLLSSWEEDTCATSRTLTLRLYCNLTNSNPGLCDDFSRSDIVEVLFKMIMRKFKQLSEHSVKQQNSTSSDDLILSLGVFVNLAESSTKVRQMVMHLHHGPQSYLSILLELFITKSKNAAEVYSEEETNMNVAVGYLSVLIGFLCLNRDVKAWVSAQLQGGTSKQLVDALDEFLCYYRQVGQEVYHGEAEGESKAGYVGRLQGLIKDLKD